MVYSSLRLSSWLSESQTSLGSTVGIPWNQRTTTKLASTHHRTQVFWKNVIMKVMSSRPCGPSPALRTEAYHIVYQLTIDYLSELGMRKTRTRRGRGDWGPVPLTVGTRWRMKFVLGQSSMSRRTRPPSSTIESRNWRLVTLWSLPSRRLQQALEPEHLFQRFGGPTEVGPFPKPAESEFVRFL
jgi:hypothetical protein